MQKAILCSANLATYINTYFCSYECRYLYIYARLQLTSSVFNLSFSYPNIDLEDARYVLHLSGKNMFLHTFRVIEVLKKQLHSSYSTHDVVKCLLKNINWNLTFFPERITLRNINNCFKNSTSILCSLSLSS